jgi:hypothetical protein
MNEISSAELFELYLDTISRSTSALLSQCDEYIAGELFEEFDIGATSYLHETSLARLQDAGYINEEIATLSTKLREKWFILQPMDSTLMEIKNANEWKEFFQMSDNLNGLVCKFSEQRNKQE